MYSYKKRSFKNNHKNSYKSKHFEFPLSREEAVEIATKECEKNAVIVCTTGMLSRELFEFRAKYKLGHGKDFMCWGNGSCISNSNWNCSRST